MIDKVWRAEKFAEEKHFGQFDRAGAPYIEHPRAVAAKVDTDAEKIVAFLHDTVEDTNATLDEISVLFGSDIAEAVGCLTHRKGVPYMDYVARLGGNEIARTVKLADLRHNSDYTRLEEIDEKARARINKYMAALKLLSESETSYRPYYDRGAQTWRVDFPDRASEEGDLLYVASEYATTGLYFPYNDASTAGREYSAHSHSFDGVIRALLDDPESFTIKGFEDHYSKQERDMLSAIQQKLLLGKE